MALARSSQSAALGVASTTGASYSSKYLVSSKFLSVNLFLAFAFDIFELPEISADLLDFLGLQLVGHVELLWVFGFGL